RAPPCTRPCAGSRRPTSEPTGRDVLLPLCAAHRRRRGVPAGARGRGDGARGDVVSARGRVPAGADADVSATARPVRADAPALLASARPRRRPRRALRGPAPRHWGRALSRTLLVWSECFGHVVRGHSVQNTLFLGWVGLL